MLPSMKVKVYILLYLNYILIESNIFTGGDILKRVELEIEKYLYEFYRKIGVQAGRSPQQVMADTLFRFAGTEVQKVLRKRKQEKGG